MSVVSYYSCCLQLFFMQVEASIGTIRHRSLGLEGRYSSLPIKGIKTKAACRLASQSDRLNC